jgi:hypothetical protein
MPATFSTTVRVTDDHDATPTPICSATHVPKLDRHVYSGHPPQHPARHANASHSVPSTKSGSTIAPLRWYE